MGWDQIAWVSIRALGVLLPAVPIGLCVVRMGVFVRLCLSVWYRYMMYVCIGQRCGWGIEEICVTHHDMLGLV